MLQRQQKCCWSSCVKLLLEHNADVNVRSRAIGVTALAAACVGGHVQVVKLLLSARASRVAQWRDMKPAQWAAAYGHLECARRLEPNAQPELPAQPASASDISNEGIETRLRRFNPKTHT